MSALHFMSQTRLIDTNGIADAAEIYFYQSGSLTPAPVYTTAELSVEHPSPIPVAAGAAVPDIYLDDETYTYRRRILYSDGTYDDLDPYISPSSGGIGFLQSGANAVSRTAQAKLRETVSVTDFEGADPTGVGDSTAAITAALATGKNVAITSGNFRASDITVAIDYQQIIALGNAKLIKNANGPLLTLTGRGAQVHGLVIDGEGSSFTGDNIVVDAQEAQFHGCSSIHAGSRALKSTSNGGATQVFGGIWHTEDSAGYEFEFDGSGSQYNELHGVSTSQTGGGVLVTGGASLAVMGGQIGKLTTGTGGGVRAIGVRIAGNIQIRGSFGTIEACNIASSSIEFGETSEPNISGVRWGPDNNIEDGVTFSIRNNVVLSSFHLHMLFEPGNSNTVNIESQKNDLWHPAIPSTVELRNGTGSAIGAGTISSTVSSHGRTKTFCVDFTLGSGFSFATTPRFRLPLAVGSVGSTGSGLVFSNGTAYAAVVQAPPGAVDVYPYSALNPAAVWSASAPNTWGDGDSGNITLTFEYEYSV